MKNIIIRILAGIGAAALLLIIIVVVGGAILNTKSVQNKLLKKSTALLSEKLNTAVDIDSVSVDLLTQDIKFSGVYVEDQQQYKMLQIDEMKVNLDLMQLTKKKVKVQSAKISGLQAELYKLSPDEPLNLQFILDAFKKDKKNEKVAKEIEAEMKKDDKKLELDIDELDLSNIKIKYNGIEAQFDKLDYHTLLNGTKKGVLSGLKANWKQQTKKGIQDCEASIETIDYSQDGDKHTAFIHGMHFFNDNHLPRKNTNRPKRGAFDVGHVDMTADMQIFFDLLQKDSIVATVKNFKATDETAGINISNMEFNVRANKKQAFVTNLVITLDSTRLEFPKAVVQLPNKKEGRELSYSTSSFNGYVILKDISKPFAPVLSNFNKPLTLSGRMHGDKSSMAFSDVFVGTLDKKLKIAAYGSITHMEDKHALQVLFHISNMKAKGNVKEEIISLFPVKKLMMKQLHTLGNISYQGDMRVVWKKEMFQGMLFTEQGNVRFNFAIDEATKFISGNLKTTNLELGNIFAVDDLGPVGCDAHFNFDISKPRTALMRKNKGGKLPIGNVKATVSEGSYKFLKVHNLIADIESDGATADGKITIKGRHTDLICNFSLMSTDSVKSKLKIRPGIKFHGLSDEDKKAKADAKAKKKQEKEEAKALRKKEKEERKRRKKEEKAAEEMACSKHLSNTVLYCTLV